jgi:amino acid adenylation domain-containing protein
MENLNNSNYLNFNGLIQYDKLSFNISANLDNDKLKLFANDYKNNLKSIIDYLVRMNRSYLTSVDINGLISTGLLNSLQKNSEIEAIYEANPLQNSLIIQNLTKNEKDDAYIADFIGEYNDSNIDNDKFKQALLLAVKKFPSLRSCFNWQEELVQIIYKNNNDIDYEYIDISNENTDYKEFFMDILVDKNRKTPYDLSKLKLFRFHLIKTDDKQYKFLFSNHHIILDGWSNPILFSFINDIYQRILNNEKVLIKEDIAYINAQKYFQENKEKTSKYWNDKIKNISEDILYDDIKPFIRENRRNVNLDTYNYVKIPKEEQIVITDEDFEKIKLFSKNNSTTISSILLYAFHKLLKTYNQDSDMTIVAVTLSGRSIGVDDVNKSVGLYINTLPIIKTHNNDSLIKNEVVNVQNSVNDANDYSNQNLAEISRINGRKIFNSLFIYENYPIDEKITKSNFKVTKTIGKLDYPLSIVAYDNDLSLVVNIKYDNDLFDLSTVKEMLSKLRNILSFISVNGNEKAKNIPLISTKEENLIINKLNDTWEDNNPDGKTVVDLFQDSVDKDPDSVALVFKDEKYSYGQLNVMVNKLANYIFNKKLDGNVFVPLVLDRSFYMIISILAVIKTGCAYVPIAPNYPIKRIKQILADIKSDILLVDNSNYEYINKIIAEFNNVNKYSLEIINIAKLFEDNLLESMDNNNLNTNININDLVYVIYTSGSTGNPKGVVIKHEGLYNNLLWMKNEYNINYKDKILQKATYTFDLSLLEIILPFLTNATLVIVDVDGEKDPIYLINLINKENITIIHLVPSMLIAFLQTLKLYKEKNNLDKPLKTLNYIFVGGELLSLNTVNEVKQLSKNTKIHNLYGPTETTIAVTYFDCNKNYLETIPIGKPITNTTFYILNKHQQLLPKGAVGELYIGGVGLAKEYLNNSELTNERFILNPYQTIQQKKIGFNDKLYKTGDLVKLNKDNNLEYIGRTDFQVKIRGYRIELDEIENAIPNNIGLKKTVVTVGKISNEDVLLLYFMTNEELNEKKMSLLKEEIRSILGEKLPSYMVPEIYINLKKFPLTMTGKIDIKKLSQVNYEDIVSDEIIPPSNALEREIHELCVNILGYDGFGVTNSLLSIGFTSLSLTKLISNLFDKYTVQINLIDVLENGDNIQDIANKILSSQKIKPIKNKIREKYSLPPHF